MRGCSAGTCSHEKLRRAYIEAMYQVASLHNSVIGFPYYCTCNFVSKSAYGRLAIGELPIQN